MDFMNLANITRIASVCKQFAANHPKIIDYFKTKFRDGVPEGTTFEIIITKPNEHAGRVKFKAKESDVKIINDMIHGD